MNDFSKNIISKVHQTIGLYVVFIHPTQGNILGQMTVSLRALTLCQRMVQGTVFFRISKSNKNALSRRCILPGMRLLKGPEVTQQWVPDRETAWQTQNLCF